MTTTYDPKCYDLALLFLADEPGLDVEAKRHELAQLIQATIEDYIANESGDLDRQLAELEKEVSRNAARKFLEGRF